MRTKRCTCSNLTHAAGVLHAHKLRQTQPSKINKQVTPANSPDTQTNTKQTSRDVRTPPGRTRPLCLNAPTQRASRSPLSASAAENPAPASSTGHGKPAHMGTKHAGVMLDDCSPGEKEQGKALSRLGGGEEGEIGADCVVELDVLRSSRASQSGKGGEG